MASGKADVRAGRAYVWFLLALSYCPCYFTESQAQPNYVPRSNRGDPESPTADATAALDDSR